MWKEMINDNMIPVCSTWGGTPNTQNGERGAARANRLLGESE